MASCLKIDLMLFYKALTVSKNSLMPMWPPLWVRTRSSLTATSRPPAKEVLPALLPPAVCTRASARLTSVPWPCLVQATRAPLVHLTHMSCGVILRLRAVNNVDFALCDDVPQPIVVRQFAGLRALVQMES